MAEINKKLVKYATEAKFEEHLAGLADKINPKSVVFIENTGRIWTHGKYYDGAWAGISGKPTTFAPSAHTLGSHSDVDITSNTSGEILKWNGSRWINNTLAQAGIATPADISTAIDGLEIGGRNLALNTQEQYKEVGSGVANKQVNPPYPVWDFEEYGLVPDDYITITYYWQVRSLTAEPISGSIYLRPRVLELGGAQSYAYFNTIVQSFSNSVTKGMTTISRKIGNAKRILSWMFRLDAPTNVELTLYNVKLEKGNKATDWSPAPEDQVSDWNETDVASFNYIKNKPTTFTPSAHTHGSITNDGKIGTLADRIIETTTGGLLTHAAKNTAYNRDFGTGVNQVAMGNHTHPNFARTVAGLVPAPGAATITRYLREDGTWVIPPNTADTHWVTGVFVGAVTTKIDAVATNPYIKIFDNNTNRGNVRIIGGTNVDVKSDALKAITITATDTTYSAGNYMTMATGNKITGNYGLLTTALLNGGADATYRVTTAAQMHAWIEGKNFSTESFVNNAIDNLEIGGRNLALKTTNPPEYLTTTARLRYQILKELLNELGGKEVTISFDIKSTASSHSFYIYDHTNANYPYASTSINTTGSGWNSISITKTISASTLPSVNPSVTITKLVDDTVEVRNMYVRYGNMKLDWTPALEDQVSDWNTTDVNSFSFIKNKPSTFTPSAHTHNASDINAGVLGIARIPTGTTSSTVALGNHTHTFASLTSKPTTLSGYGITDGVQINSSNWVDFKYTNVAEADKDIVENVPGSLKLDGWHNTNIGVGYNYGTRLTINGQPGHDKTQLYFNGGNGSIQYRKSWYNNAPWTALRTIWDSGNLATGTTAQYIRGDGSLATYSDTTYSEITEAQTVSTSSSVVGLITGRRLKYAFDNITAANASSATKLANITTTFTGKYPVTFNVNGTIYSHTGITYTGSTNTLTTSNFAGSGASLTSLNASQLTTGTVPNSVLSGTYDGMSLRLINGNTVSMMGTGTRSGMMLASRGVWGAATGAIVFIAPYSTGSQMNQFEISGYAYSPRKTYKYILSNYNYTTASPGHNLQKISLGSHDDISVRVGRTSSGNWCIILGDESTTWQYPQFELTKVMGGNVAESNVIGWTTDIVTDLSTYTNITNPTHNAGIATDIYGNAATATKVNNKLTLKFDTGTTENTNLYTYDGSAAKTIDIKAGSNVSFTKTANTITVNSTNTNTTYSAMSVAEGTTGTATSSRTMRADYLKQIIQYYDTNSVTGIRAGASGTTTNAAVTSPYIKVLDDTEYRSQIRLSGGGATTVSSDASGNITISSTNTNTNTFVTQANTTSSTYRAVLLGYTTSSTPTSLTTTVTNQAYLTSKIYVQPSTGNLITAGSISVGGGIDVSGFITGAMGISLNGIIASGTAAAAVDFFIKHKNNTILTSFTGSNEVILSNRASSGTIRINPNGEGVSYGGITITSQNMAVDGNITCTKVFESSDVRLKENINKINTTFVDNIDLVEFTWKRDKKKDYGVIAQRVEQYYPELVSTDREGMKKVNYGSLYALKIKRLEERIKELEDKL